MKRWLKPLLPRFVRRSLHRRKLLQEARRSANRTPAEVFAEIYRDRKWGGTGAFCSGSGSSTASIVEPYVATIQAFLRSHGPEPPTLVDLGCGDFSVGSRLVEYCSEYIGVDVVPDLVRHLQSSAGGGRVRFLCLDITRDELPAADICLIRQVFQHLSNEQILRVLPKLGRYQAVFITEHHPRDGPSVVPNLDKVHGSGIRLYESSGVYLDRPPFNIPSSDLELVLEVSGEGFGGLYDPGVIRTFRLSVPRSA